MSKIVVSEAGASVYSASAFASEELPGLDVTLRGAVSIARRLQDPLAELVKIDPKSIGVGQYQHDLGESKLSRSLDAVVEDCVNAVGVDANTASAPYWRAYQVSVPDSPKASSSIATQTVHSRPAKRSRKSRGSAQKRSNNVRASCASMPARIPSMHPAFIRNHIRWCGEFLPRPKATSRH